MGRSGNLSGAGSQGPGYSIVNKWGTQIDIDTTDTPQIIWPVKSVVQSYIFLDAPIQLFVVSTSTADTAAGTGVRTIKGMYHDNNGESVDLSLSLDGTNNVALPTTSYGVFRFSVDSSGSGNTNAGQIKIVDGAANIYTTIEIGEGQTQISVFRCPNNKKGLIVKHVAEYGRTGGGNEASMRLKIRKVDGTVITKWDPEITTLNTSDVVIYEKGGIKMLPGEWVYWECILVSANNTPIRGTFNVELQDV